MDTNAWNYNCDALWDDGSCVEVVMGCTDPQSPNFNLDATEDDGSCVDYIAGCTNSGAMNYNPLATISNENCTFCPNTQMDGLTITGFTCPTAAQVADISTFNATTSDSIMITFLLGVEILDR